MDQKQFVLERFYYEWKMDIVVFDNENKIKDFFIGAQNGISCLERKRVDEATLQIVNDQCFDEIRLRSFEAQIPLIYMVNEGIYYITFVDEEDNFYMFGPASVNKLSFMEQIVYRKQHNIKNQNYEVPKVSLNKSLNGIILIYYVITGKQVGERDIINVSKLDIYKNASNMDIYQIQNEDEERKHLSYNDEQKWVAQIENGTLYENDVRITSENLAKLEKIGKLASGNSLKQFEYMVVTSTVLASRAAIRGGANVYNVYQKSELFMQKVSQCKNAMEMLKIHSQVAAEFSKEVRKARENRSNNIIEQCKDYISCHKTHKFSLKEVAGYVGKNANYLSRIFSEQTGMTMQEYSLNIRLDAVADMLRCSDKSIGVIAVYLGFPSHSYMGERFKKKYGVSPTAYRKQYRIRDFKE